MKKSAVLGPILGVLVLLMSTSLASAQLTWSAGVKGGINLGKFTGDDTSVAFSDEGVTVEGDIDSAKLGVLGGGFVTAHISETFGVRFEALYVRKGGKGDVTASDGTTTVDGEYKVKLDYFEIPLLAVGMFPVGESAVFNVFAGPTISFNASAKESFELLDQEEEEDIPDEAVKSTDFGATIGLGIEFQVHESANLLLDVRYTLGLTRAFEDEEFDGETMEIDIKNTAIGVMAGVSFPFGAGGGS